MHLDAGPVGGFLTGSAPRVLDVAWGMFLGKKTLGGGPGGEELLGETRPKA